MASDDEGGFSEQIPLCLIRRVKPKKNNKKTTKKP